MEAVSIPANTACVACSLHQIVLEQAAIIEALKKRITELEKQNKELEARLRKYENPHTPSSLKEKPNKLQKEKKGIPGRPPGHKGTTRPLPTPEKTVKVKARECPICHKPLGDPLKIERRIVEDIPEPQPVTVTEYLVAHYQCSCGEHIIAKHHDLPKEGILGPRALAHITLLKYDDRLPLRRVCRTLKREFRLEITPATVLDVTRRVSDALNREYEIIKKRIREAPVVYIDETSIMVNRRRYWIWVFTTEADTLVVIRHSRGKKVLKEVLGKKFEGIIVCDGYKSYSNYTTRLQRCWAHILRESKFVAKHSPEGKPVDRALKRLYRRLVDALLEDPPPDERERLYRNAINLLRYWLSKEYGDERVVKFVEKVRNGMKHLLTFVLCPGVEPTNNRAERALREHVVIRKIIGTLRNEKGTMIHETIMSCLATWKQQDLNPYDEIIKQVS